MPICWVWSMMLWCSCWSNYKEPIAVSAIPFVSLNSSARRTTFLSIPVAVRARSCTFGMYNTAQQEALGLFNSRSIDTVMIFNDCTNITKPDRHLNSSDLFSHQNYCSRFFFFFFVLRTFTLCISFF